MYKIGLILLVIIAAIGGYYYYDQSASDSQKDGGSIAVDVIHPYNIMLEDRVQALGTARANESIDVTSTVSEYLDEISVADGAQIKKGDVIVRLRQDEEQAELKAAQIQLAEHQRELKRLQTLMTHKAASQRDVDERQTQLRLTQQEINQVEARIADRTIRAPFDGVVGIRRLSPGSLVQPGQVITTLDDINTIKLDFTVPETQMNAVNKGMNVAITHSSSDKALSGIVDTVAVRLDDRSRAGEVRVLLDNPDGLIKPGMLMHIAIHSVPRNAVVVPEEAVFQIKRNHFVYVVDGDNKVQQRQIHVGARRPGVVEVRDGIVAQDKVVMRGVVKLRPMQSVTIAKTWDKPQDKPQDKR